MTLAQPRRRSSPSPEDHFIDLVRMTASRLPERASVERVRVPGAAEAVDAAGGEAQPPAESPGAGTPPRQPGASP